MDAGKMDKLIGIMRPSPTEGAYGGQNVGYALVETIYAEVLEAGGRQFFEGGFQGEAFNVFRFYYREDVTMKWAISYKGRTYEIKALKELGFREGLEVVGEGLAL